MMLKTETDRIVFWYGDLEKLYGEVYNEKLNILEGLRDSHDYFGQHTYYEFETNGDDGFFDTVGDEVIYGEWLATGETDNIYVDEDWSNARVELRHILQRLLEDGFIEPGKYLMKVWW
jgi:hypothetical protein